MRALLVLILGTLALPLTSQGVNPFVMGFGQRTSQEMANFLYRHNPSLGREFCEAFAQMYVEEAAWEGVNHDLAFAQMCLETSYLRFGGQVQRQQNNFCGLGALDDGSPGLSFPDERTGIRAQIQHLKAYGNRQDLQAPLVDPRFRFVQRGVAPVFSELTLRWASDPEYARQIVSILARLERG